MKDKSFNRRFVRCIKSPDFGKGMVISLIITKYRWFWAWDYDKEEKWLNEMSEKGLQLTSVSGFRYQFEEDMEEKYTYRIELLDNLPGSEKSRNYIEFLEETGVKVVGSYLRWIYLRKKKSEGGFELFSDLDSRINHLNRILMLLVVFIPIELCASLRYWCTTREHMDTGSMTVGLLTSILTLLLSYGVFHIYGKKKKLKEERNWHE